MMKPSEIEAQSFAIIDREAGPHGFGALEWPVVRRIVHTAADFEFIANTVFSSGAIQAGLEALRRGEGIYCDTGMVLAGVSKSRLEPFGCRLFNFVADPQVAADALAEGTTRSAVAMRRGIEAGCGVFLIGNAPTALFELLRLVNENKVRPSLVVGVPVGFVGAVESKEALLASDLTTITCRGRKGGSAIAAAILNALVILAQETP